MKRDALQADLLKIGRTLDDLGTSGLSWYDLKVLAADFLKRHDSALSRELNGVYWSTEGQLLAVVADALHVANWQRGGKRSAPRPKPIKRPWEKAKGRIVGSKPIPISQFSDWWDSKTAAAADRKKARRKTRIAAKRKPPTE